MMQELSKKILVIEDDTITRNIFLDGLEAEGFDSIGAENGLDGIRQAQEYLPDLIICDVMMPDMDGYGVLTELRQHPMTSIIPFIFLTGCDTKASLRKGMELGADDYLTKPATVEDLLRAIASRLYKQNLFEYWYTAKCNANSESISTTSVEPEPFFPTLPQLKDIFDYIEANFDKGITLCDVADAVGYSAAYLTNRVAKQTGESINNWIVKRRMLAARSLLCDTDQTISQIATSLGYQNACHFSRQFRQHHGLPPQSWRKEYQLSLTSNLVTC
jgi:YesN/AraC family two-component response regulator